LSQQSDDWMHASKGWAQVGGGSQVQVVSPTTAAQGVVARK
jgi:hypothetical protein